MTKKQKEHVSILHDAAELITLGRSSCCCGAIDMATNFFFREAPEENIMRRIYLSDAKKYRPLSSYWWDLRDQESRILALLLAAEMIRTNSLP